MNWRNIKLIQFEDGSFGVRRGWVFHSYMDFATKGFWWGAASQFAGDCKTTKPRAMMAIMGKHKVVSA